MTNGRPLYFRTRLVKIRADSLFDVADGGELS